MRTYTDSEVEASFDEIGVPLDAYVLVGEAGHESPGFWVSELGFRYVIIENDELARASVGLLARRGARRFGGEADVVSTAHRERWPCWEVHAPVLRPW